MSKQEMIQELRDSLDDIGNGVEPVWDMEIVAKFFEPAREKIRKVISALEAS